MLSRNRLIAAALILAAGIAFGQQPPAEPQKQQPPQEGKKEIVYAQFETSLGNFKVLLYTDKTPVTAQNFIDLVEGKKAHMDTNGQMVSTPMYDGRKIFRVIKQFMFQTGSANDTGAYNSGFRIPDEFPAGLAFDRPGLLAMANAGPGTGSTQFFVTFAPTPWLTNKHTIFGEVIEGMDTIQKIESVPVQSGRGEGSTPVEMPVINKVTIERTAK